MDDEPGEGDDDDGEEAAGTNIAGIAKDDGVTRYRPLVAMARTQLSSKGAQAQAEWMARTARAAALKLEYLVRGYDMNDRLWRPNELALVDDTFQDIHRDLLIAGVVFGFDAGGETTRLRVTGPEAFDVEPEESRATNHKRATGKSTGALDGTAEAL